MVWLQFDGDSKCALVDVYVVQLFLVSLLSRCRGMSCRFLGWLFLVRLVAMHRGGWAAGGRNWEWEFGPRNRGDGAFVFWSNHLPIILLCPEELVKLIFFQVHWVLFIVIHASLTWVGDCHRQFCSFVDSQIWLSDVHRPLLKDG